MARKRPTVGISSIVASLGDTTIDDDVTTAVLDATASLLGVHGLHRWSMDDVADRAGVGRTSVYRRFANRDDLVSAVLARELRSTFAAIDRAARQHESLEDKVIEGGLVALGALRDSLVEQLLFADPTTFLPYLTTGAGPLIAIARQVLVRAAQGAGIDAEPAQLAEMAEVAARLGLSFILTRDSVFPADDDEALRASLRRVLAPMLAVLTP